MVLIVVDEWLNEVSTIAVIEQQDANERRINKVKCERLFESIESIESNPNTY